MVEPGLEQLLIDGQRSGHLQVVDDVTEAGTCDVVWITFDTPLDAGGAADAGWVAERVEGLTSHLSAGALVVVSSQVPLGFTRAAGTAARAAWPAAEIRFACVPENLRLGKAIGGFARAYAPAGTEDGAPDPLLAELLSPWVGTVDWMTLELSVLSNQATNALLVTTVSLTN